jgi:hypothetical protein
MNARILHSLLAILIASTLSAAQAGTYSLSSSSCDRGGGSRSAGLDGSGRAKFMLAGTVGQPDAGASAAGTYFQQGGFVPALQKTVGPALKFTPSGGALLVTWPASSCRGFHLEASATVAGPWLDFGEGIALGPERVVAVSQASGHGFFRLRKACAGGCPQSCPE